MSLSAWGKGLEEFANNNNVTILLATIGAGGVGLNLTSTSRVYIMEPQYNLTAVAQAVDRVHWLGQNRLEHYRIDIESVEEKRYYSEQH